MANSEPPVLPLAVAVASKLSPDLSAVAHFGDPLPAKGSYDWGASLLRRRERLEQLVRAELGVPTSADAGAVWPEDDEEIARAFARATKDEIVVVRDTRRETSKWQQPEYKKIGAVIDDSIREVCAEVVTGKSKAYGYDRETRQRVEISAAWFFRPLPLLAVLENRIGRRFEDVVIVRVREFAEEARAAIEDEPDHLEAEVPASSDPPRRGAKRKYDWEAFQCEIARIANTPDGLPEFQADLERIMAKWCENKWGKARTESMIRLHVAKVYKALREGRN